MLSLRLGRIRSPRGGGERSRHEELLGGVRDTLEELGLVAHQNAHAVHLVCWAGRGGRRAGGASEGGSQGGGEGGDRT